jgi:hypothetical protein
MKLRAGKLLRLSPAGEMPDVSFHGKSGGIARGGGRRTAMTPAYKQPKKAAMNSIPVG